MKRRRALLYAGVAAAAGATGIGTALWRQQRADASAADPIWAQRFERPEGGELAMSAYRKQPLLLNFWATWCPPCVGELPLLDRFQRAQAPRGWQVIGLAIDQRAPVLAFLQKHPIGFPVGLAGIDGIDLARRLGNAGGALPFTVVFDRGGRIAHRKLGVIEPTDLQAWEQAAA
jgi:thiol-disulfide isomerase/thioredoxin